MCPVVVAAVQGLLDEQAAKAGAIDVQVRGHATPVFESQRFDEAVGGAQRDVDHLAIDAGHAAGLGILSQVGRVQPGVEVIGMRVQHAEAGRRPAAVTIRSRRAMIALSE